jgi:hypothetical protein
MGEVSPFRVCIRIARCAMLALAWGDSLAGPLLAETIYAAACDRIVRFDSATPEVIADSIPLPDIFPYCLTGLDFDPRSGRLYGYGVQECLILCPPDPLRALFVIEPVSGAAELLWTIDSVAPEYFGITDLDVIPATGEIRFANGLGGYNLRWNPATGVETLDSLIAPVRPLAGLAHSPNSQGSVSFATIAIATAGSPGAPPDLVRIGGPAGAPPASSGELTVIAPLGVALHQVGGFDISPSGAAYLAGWDGASVNLYSVNLTTGTTADLGAIGGGSGLFISGLAIDVTRGVSAIPTLGETGIGAFVVALGLAGIGLLHRRRPGLPRSR